MWHFVDWQLFLALAVAVENALDAALGVPQIDERQAIVAEKTRHVVTAIGRDQTVVGLAADVREFLYLRPRQVGEVHDPNLPRLEKTEHEAAAGRVDQAHDFRALAIRAIGRGNVGDQTRACRRENTLTPPGV